MWGGEIKLPVHFDGGRGEEYRNWGGGKRGEGRARSTLDGRGGSGRPYARERAAYEEEDGVRGREKATYTHEGEKDAT